MNRKETNYLEGRRQGQIKLVWGMHDGFASVLARWWHQAAKAGGFMGTLSLFGELHLILDNSNCTFKWFGIQTEGLQSEICCAKNCTKISQAVIGNAAYESLDNITSTTRTHSGSRSHCVRLNHIPTQYGLKKDKLAAELKGNRHTRTSFDVAIFMENIWGLRDDRWNKV